MSSKQHNHPDWHEEIDRAGHYAKNTLGGFKTFILRGNVVDLAIGIIIGAAFTSVVNALVSDVITPLIPVSGGNLSAWHWSVPYNTKATLNVGAFINAVISFLIVAVVLYLFIVRPVGALLERYKPEEVQPTPETRDCPYCLQAIPLLATRCAFCTSPLAPENAQTNNTAPPQTANRQ